MVYKIGKFGRFLACPGYPECKNTKAIVETFNVPCPVCGGNVIVKKSRRGKKFYVCENNPGKCEYISWNKPKVGEIWSPEKTHETEKKTRKRRSSAGKGKAKKK